jgi:hypothetical protein
MRCVVLSWLIDDAFVFVKVCKLLTKTHAALIAESGSPAVPTDAEPPRSCALCAAFGRQPAEEPAACALQE